MPACLGPDAPAGAIVKVSTQPGARGHTRLPSASRLTETPGHCMRSQQSGQQVLYAPPHEFGLSTKLYSRLTSLCLGLRASEEERFACILRFGRKLESVYKLTLPLVTACSCACVIRLSRAHCKTTRSNGKATNDLHSHMTRHMASHENTSADRTVLSCTLCAGTGATRSVGWQFRKLGTLVGEC